MQIDFTYFTRKETRVFNLFIAFFLSFKPVNTDKKGKVAHEWQGVFLISTPGWRNWCGRHSGLMLCALGIPHRVIWFKSYPGHCIVFLGKTLYSHSARLFYTCQVSRLWIQSINLTLTGQFLTPDWQMRVCC